MKNGWTKKIEQLERELLEVKASYANAVAILDEVIGKNADVIENNPDEGSFCFFCGQEWSKISGVHHSKLCPVTRGRAVLRAVK